MIKHVHLIGMAGSGLSAIARVLVESGYVVSGSDRQANLLTDELQAMGARFYTGHAAANIQGADVVVRSSAIPDDNPEVAAAEASGIRVMKRADFLGFLTQDHQTIAVAGTHGKTTTTAMIAWMLTRLKQDPSYIIGGVSKDLGSNAHAGKGSMFVIEADEYDFMFLGLQPKLAVITNVEYDHPDCYPTRQDYNQAFTSFTSRIQQNGILLACQDDEGAKQLQKTVPAGSLGRGYGLDNPASYQAVITGSRPGFGYNFSALYRPQGKEAVEMGVVKLEVPGKHNVLNAMAAMAVAHSLGLSTLVAAQALSQYHGAGRRFEVIGETMGITIVDDYAHHPTEIRATLSAARSRYPTSKIWAVWQPHTYSRTQTLAADFIHALALADRIIVTEIYAAREPKQAYSARDIVSKMDTRKAVYLPDFNDVIYTLLQQLSAGDVLLVLSAGDADQISAQVFKGLKEREANHA